MLLVTPREAASDAIPTLSTPLGVLLAPADPCNQLNDSDIMMGLPTN